MKDIVIFEDGKTFRGSRAKLIKRGNKRVLIEFMKYDYIKGEDILVTEWFKVFQCTWAKYPKYNNKRKKVSYYHEETNEFYTDEKQTDKFKEYFKSYVDEEYYYELFGHE